MLFDYLIILHVFLKEQFFVAIFSLSRPRICVQHLRTRKDRCCLLENLQKKSKKTRYLKPKSSRLQIHEVQKLSTPLHDFMLKRKYYLFIECICYSKRYCSKCARFHVVFSFLILSTEEILQYIFPLKESVPQMSFNGSGYFFCTQWFMSEWEWMLLVIFPDHIFSFPFYVLAR